MPYSHPTDTTRHAKTTPKYSKMRDTTGAHRSPQRHGHGETQKLKDTDLIKMDLPEFTDAMADQYAFGRTLGKRWHWYLSQLRWPAAAGSSLSFDFFFV